MKSSTNNAAKYIKHIEKKQLTDMPDNLICPCGGGQSCLVDRRWLGDWVHEDDIFKNSGIPLRKNCYSNYNEEQKKLLGLMQID
jgi:hypothetical protein